MGYDTDEAYVAAARARVADEIDRLTQRSLHPSRRAALPAVPTAVSDEPPVQAVREGRKAKEVALLVLEECGFTDVRIDVRFPTLGVEVGFVARDAAGADWAFDVSGGFTSTRSGLRRSDTLWKALAKAAVLHQAHPRLPLVLLTTDLPVPSSPGDASLRAVLGAGRPVRDVVEILAPAAQARLRRHAAGSAAEG